MLVFWRQRLVFLATPKTASTAIESALGSLAAVVIVRPPALKHTNAQRFHRFLAPFLADASGRDFALTALMREPRDWLGSWYRYRQREEEVPEKSTRDISFDEFIHAYCRDERPEFAKVGSQAQFLAPKNKPPVDFIFRYENITEFVHFLEDRLDCEINLPRMNVSPVGDTALTAASEALLRSYCARDFEIYQALLGD
ncbi:MAG: hypothetical protein V9G14_11605 [Cypionkella sp.]|nr:hypothetical protein [Cypionkella sp.]